jgi:predicted acyl esterase
VAIPDVSGHHDSEGDWDRFDPKQKIDGHDRVQWLAKQA